MSALDRLQDELPSPDAMLAGQSPGFGCRAVLALVIERALSSPPTERTESDPLLCPNCGTPTQNDRSPYCSDACRAQAAFVRQVRAGLAEGTIFDEDRQIALGEKLWHTLGGGYPRRRSLATDSIRSKVIGREGGLCEVCGAPAVTIDHAGSG